MIITKQMMMDMGICSASFDEGVALGLDGMKFDDAIQTFRAAGHTKWAAWLRAHRADIILASDNFRFGGYRVTNPLTQEVTLCETIEQAQATRHAIKQYFLVAEAHRFAANQEIEHDNGDVTWLPVDLDACEYEDRYQVFNQATGTYELCETLAAAKAKFAEIKEQCAEQNVPQIQQQIISGDESAWVTNKNVLA